MASFLFSLRAWQYSNNLFPGPLWFSPWSWTLNFSVEVSPSTYLTKISCKCNDKLWQCCDWNKPQAHHVRSRLSNVIVTCLMSDVAFSALTLSVGRQQGQPDCKNWVVGCWRGYPEQGTYDPADATATHCLLLFGKIEIGFTFLVPAHLGIPGQGAVKRV